MGVTLPNTGITLPTLGGDPGTWDDELNAALTTLDRCDHSPGKGVQIPVNGLNINADLPLGGHGLISTGRVAFSTVAALTTGANALFVNSADGELYYRTTGGVNVKLTNGNGINTTLVGGIVGDYAAVGAALAYDDANSVYTFKRPGAPAPWAHIAAGGVQLYEFNTTETVYTQLKAAPALAASYDITLPVALPASTMIVTLDNAGNLSLGASASMATDANITLSGAGTYKHGTKTKTGSFLGPLANVSAGTVSTTAGQPGMKLGNNSIVYYPLPPIAKHERLVGFTIYFDSAVNRNDCTATLYRTDTADPAGATFTTTALTFSHSGTALLLLTPINLQCTGSEQFWVQIGNSLTTPTAVGWAMDYDVP